MCHQHRPHIRAPPFESSRPRFSLHHQHSETTIPIFMIQQRSTSPGRAPGSLEAAGFWVFFHLYSQGISFFNVALLLAEPGSRLSTASSDQNLVFLEFSSLSLGTPTHDGLFGMPAVCNLAFPARSRRGTTSAQSSSARNIGLCNLPFPPRWGHNHPTNTGNGRKPSKSWWRERRREKKKKSPQTFHFQRHNPKTRRPKKPLLWFPFARVKSCYFC